MGADDITVTTATQTEAEVREALAPKPAAAAPATPAAPVAPKPAAAAASTAEAEADSERPDPEVSEAARTLRQSRASERLARIQSDIELYEDNIRQLGGTVPPFVPRTYPNAQAQIDHYTRRRHDLLEVTNKALRAPRKKVDEPAAPGAAKPAAAAPAAPEPPKFEFPTWEEYQEKHPDRDYIQYTDERSDARDSWKEGVRKATAAFEKKQADEAAADTARTTQQQSWADRRAAAIAEADTHTTTFKATKPDFDAQVAALGGLLITAGLASVVNEQLVFSAKWKATQDVLARSPKEVASVLYHLATHPADVTRLSQVTTPDDLEETLTDIRFTVRSATPAAAATGAAAAAAAPAAGSQDPPRPMSATPAPLAPVSGDAQITRTIQQIADDSENADEYIVARKRELRAAG